MKTLKNISTISLTLFLFSFSCCKPSNSVNLSELFMGTDPSGNYGISWNIEFQLHGDKLHSKNYYKIFNLNNIESPTISIADSLIFIQWCNNSDVCFYKSTDHKFYQYNIKNNLFSEILAIRNPFDESVKDFYSEPSGIKFYYNSEDHLYCAKENGKSITISDISSKNDTIHYNINFLETEPSYSILDFDIDINKGLIVSYVSNSEFYKILLFDYKNHTVNKVIDHGKLYNSSTNYIANFSSTRNSIIYNINNEDSISVYAFDIETGQSKCLNPKTNRLKIATLSLIDNEVPILINSSFNELAYSVLQNRLVEIKNPEMGLMYAFYGGYSMNIDRSVNKK